MYYSLHKLCPIDKARDPRASALESLALSSLHTVFGHGLRNLCHRNGAKRPGEPGEMDGCCGECGDR